MNDPRITVREVLGALSPEARNQILTILQRNTDELETTKDLKRVLRAHEAALSRIGLIPDFTAYALLHARNKANR